MTRSIGFIAEDVSDVEVLKILITKISKKTFTSAHFVGKGCGPIKKKIPGWSKAFTHKGVNHLLVVHDLDRNNEKSLRASLEDLVNATSFQTKAVVIPKEELEAWLLSDENAIFSALKLETTPKKISHPETINSPKEHLQELVQKNSKGGTNNTSTPYTTKQLPRR